jgi:hypothetical protein
MKQRLKAISLWQPWATLLAAGVKTWETRGWATSVNGVVAIHSAKRRTMDQKFSWGHFQAIPEVRVLGDWDSPVDYPFGAIVGVGHLTRCVQMNEDNLGTPEKPGIWSEFEKAFGDYRVGRWAWRFEYTQRFHRAIPCAGQQGFFEVEVDL